MAELMGICGVEPDEIRRTLDRMQAHIGHSGGARVDRWEGEGLGLLRFHHGVINPEPQPLFNEDRSLLAAMDGEVFGYEAARRELTRAGHRFLRADNDAEYVLHLYEQKGEAGFCDLTGSYSIVLYALALRRLLLVTDRLFSRPVFYCRQGPALVFSSRFNALVACGALDGGRLDMTAVMQFFTFQHAQFASTFCREARAMPPASVLEFAGGEVRQRKYWRLRYGAAEQNRERCLDRLTDALRQAAWRMTDDTCRKGVMLSGGVDSRVFLAAADGGVTSYTVGDWPNREVATARRCARVRGSRIVFLRRPPDHYAAILDEAVELTGGMARFDNCQFLGLLDRVRGDCDVLFNEDAMDALFKGYYWQRRLSWKGTQVPVPLGVRFTRDRFEEQILRMPAKSMFPSSPWLLFREPWRSRYREVLYASVREQIADALTDNPYNMAEHIGGLASLGRALHNLTCVRSYVEYRALSLDSDLLDLAVQTPVRFRMGGQLVHEALRRLDGRLYAIPSGNTGLRFDAPAGLAWASQMAREAGLFALKAFGFVPLTHTNEGWPDRAEVLRTSRLRNVLEATVHDPAAIEPSVFDTARVEELLRQHMSRERHHMRMLLCLLTFGRWFARFGPSRVE